jgi:hypothetical protein
LDFHWEHPTQPVPDQVIQTLRKYSKIKYTPVLYV